ncbi:inverse autotransporter beta domain-containing protein [Candidatus Mycalebacterium sp.]
MRYFLAVALLLPGLLTPSVFAERFDGGLLVQAAPPAPDFGGRSSYFDEIKISSSDLETIFVGIDSGNLKEQLTQRAVAVANSFANEHIDALEERAERLSFLSELNLEWQNALGRGRKNVFQFDTVLAPIDSGNFAVLVQSGAQIRDEDLGLFGGGVIRGNFDDVFVVGFNFFYDYLNDPGTHHRFSWGGEINTKYVDLYANRYWRISNGQFLDGGTRYAYTPNGWDVGLIGRHAIVPWIDLEARYYKWNRGVSIPVLPLTIKYDRPDIKGFIFRAGVSPFPLLTADFKYETDEKVKDGDYGFGVRLTYIPSKTPREHIEFYTSGETASPWENRHKRVSREYQQRIQFAELERFSIIETISVSRNIARDLVSGITLTTDITTVYNSNAVGSLSDSRPAAVLEQTGNLIDGKITLGNDCGTTFSSNDCSIQFHPTDALNKSVIFDWTAATDGFGGGTVLIVSRNGNYDRIEGSTLVLYLNGAETWRRTIQPSDRAQQDFSLTVPEEIFYDEMHLVFDENNQNLREIEVRPARERMQGYRLAP